jgi:hypothetical protein
MTCRSRKENKVVEAHHNTQQPAARQQNGIEIKNNQIQSNAKITGG